MFKSAALRQGFLIRRLPGGRQGDPFADQASLLGPDRVRTILDIGAYLGETVVTYRRLFPSATVHCFEPVTSSFESLKAIAARDQRVLPIQAVVSDQVGTAKLHVSRFAFNSSTLPPAARASEVVQADLFEGAEPTRVESTTIDHFCLDSRIEHIDILKLDIQGGELAALRGAAQMLLRGAVSLVYTEVLVAPLYQGQSGVGELFNELERYGYRVYGLYNFAFGAGSQLYQIDAILLSPELTDRLMKIRR